MSDSQKDFPDLPIMEELGVQLEAAAAREDATAGAVQSRAPKRTWSRPSGWLTGRLRPVAWAALVVLAVAALAIPVALFTSSSSPPTDPSPGVENDATIARGSGPQDPWALTLDRERDRSCLQLKIGGTTEPGAQTCFDDPAADSPNRPPAMAGRPPVDFAVTNGPQDGFVFGTVESTAAQVRVSAGEQQGTTDAQTPGGRLAQQGLKVFVATFDEPLDPTKTVEVVALDQQGDAVGRLSRPARR